MLTLPASSAINSLPPYPSEHALALALKTATHDERAALVRLWLTEGIPRAFERCPIAYEYFRAQIAAAARTSEKNVMAVGSIRLGYSLSPHKYGEPLSVNSDLDAAIVDSELFAAARRAFGEWQDGIVAGRWKPRNATEERYWREAGSAVPVNAGRGFVDTKFLPATLPFVRSLHNPLIQVIRKLRTLSGTPKLNAEKSSVRVYRDWPAALRQIEQNIRGLAHHLARASHDPPGGRTT